MQQYSEDFKQAIIKKSLLAGGPSIKDLAYQNDLAVTTVYGWVRKYANQLDMKNSNKWTAEQKFQALIETSSLTENDLGEYLRKNGLHSSDLKEWKEGCKLGIKGAGRPQLSPEVLSLKKEKKSLQKDLKRKNTALAEMSARVILLKKSHALFEELEDDE